MSTSYSDRRTAAETKIGELETQRTTLQEEITQLQELVSIVELESKAELLQSEVEKLLEAKKQLESKIPAQPVEVPQTS